MNLSPKLEIFDWELCQNLALTDFHMKFPHNLSESAASTDDRSAFLLKAGLAQNLKNGVIMDVVSLCK